MSPSVDTVSRFRFGDVFPADDQAAEFVATLSLAFNDIQLVHSQFDEAFEGPAYRYLYLLRVALGHLNEAAKYLLDTSDIPKVKEFVESLPADVQGHYVDCLKRYQERKGFLAQVRSLSAFHYPEMKKTGGRRLMQRILGDIADATSSTFKGASGTIEDSRMLFGDDIVSRLFTYGAKTDAESIEHHIELKEATTSFMRFANGAMNEWIGRAIDRGVVFTKTAETPPSFGALLERVQGPQTFGIGGTPLSEGD